MNNNPRYNSMFKSRSSVWAQLRWNSHKVRQGATILACRETFIYIFICTQSQKNAKTLAGNYLWPSALSLSIDDRQCWPGTEHHWQSSSSSTQQKPSSIKRQVNHRDDCRSGFILLLNIFLIPFCFHISGRNISTGIKWWWNKGALYWLCIWRSCYLSWAALLGV